MKIYENIGVLNLSKGSKEELKEIHKLINIGTLITAKDQAEDLSHIEMTNIGDQIAIDSSKEVGMVMRNGELDIKGTYLEELEKNVFLIINGALRFEDMPLELLRKVQGIVINGRIFAPEKVYSKISDRVKINGEVLTYPEGYNFIKGDFDLKEENLFGLTDKSKVALNSLKVLEQVDQELVGEKIEKMFILKELITTKGNLRWLAPMIENYTDVTKTIVPEGYDYFEELDISEENLSLFIDKQIYIKKQLKIELPFSKVKGKILDIKGGVLKVPEGENEAYREIAKDIDIKIFNPNAIKNYAKLVIDSKYLEDKENIIIENYGMLNFKEDINLEDIKRSIQNIENYGMIKCSEEIHSAVTEAVKENYGTIKPMKEEKESQEDKGYTKISNIGVLEL